MIKCSKLFITTLSDKVHYMGLNYLNHPETIQYGKVWENPLFPPVFCCLLLFWLPLLCHYKGESKFNVEGLLPWLSRFGSREKQPKTFCNGLQFPIFVRVSGEKCWCLDRVATGHYFCPQDGEKLTWGKLFAHWKELWWYLKEGSCQA